MCGYFFKTCIIKFSRKKNKKENKKAIRKKSIIIKFSKKKRGRIKLYLI